MSEINPTTDGDQPVVTGGDTPAATQPQGQPAATDDETVTLKKADIIIWFQQGIVRITIKANSATLFSLLQKSVKSALNQK